MSVRPIEMPIAMVVWLKTYFQADFFQKEIVNVEQF